ncbi:MAG: hypothetical protein ACSLFP_06820 [Acidimicrobiales bacterium]
MHTSRALAAALLSLALLVAGCGDDDADLDTGAPSTDGSDAAGDGSIEPAPDGSDVAVPDRPADLVGTITEVTPFVPVTEDCTPPEDLDPDGTVSSDDPPVCTPADNDVVGSLLVEEQAGVQQGRKISYTVTTSTGITGQTADGELVGVFGQLAEGQIVESWVPADGMCAQSYPEQCAADTIKVTG